METAEAGPSDWRNDNETITLDEAYGEALNTGTVTVNIGICT